MRKSIFKCMSLTLIIFIVLFAGTLNVKAVGREVTGIKAFYTGTNVLKGTQLSPNQFTVIVEYNDGTWNRVSGFEVFNPYILHIGQNRIAIVYKENGKTYTAMVDVTGYETVSPSTGSSTSFSQKLADGSVETTIKANICGQAYYYGADVQAAVISREAINLKKLVHMISYTDKYIGFDLGVKNYTLSDKTPLIVTVTIPSSFEFKNSAVFYSPGGSSVMAKMNGWFINNSTYQFYVYEAGTYIIMECKDDVSGKPQGQAKNQDVSYNSYIVLEELQKPVKVNGQSALIPHFYNYEGDEKEVELFWNSDNHDVVKVNEEGIVTGISPGTAKVTVSSADNLFYAVQEVKVVAKKPLDYKITINALKITLKKGMEFKIKASVVPASATYKRLKYTSSDKSIASVSEGGRIIGRKKGSCYVLVKAGNESRLYKRIKVTVS